MHEVGTRTRSGWLAIWSLLLAVTMVAATQTSALGAPPPPRYEVIDLGTLGGNASFALDLNDRGQVTGNSRTSTTTLPLEAFSWSDGEMTELGTLPGSNPFSRGYAINNRGVVVGESDNDRPRAFRWEGGELTDLGDLGGGSAVAHDVNDPGQIVGASSDGTVTRPFVWRRGEMRDLGTVAGGAAAPGRAWGINDRGDIVGVSRVAGTTSQATLWAGPNRPRLGQPVSLGSLGDGERFSEAFAINDRRQAVGRSLVTGSTERAFLWEEGAGMTDLGSLGLNHSRAMDINQRGQVVGYASTFAGFATLSAAAGFLWQDGTMYDLNDLVEADSGWELLVAEGINARGAIAGYGRIDGQTRAFLLVPTGR
jgi:probable HAF family extracellular repeat protein